MFLQLVLTHLGSCEGVDCCLYSGEVPLAQGVAGEDVPPDALDVLGTGAARLARVGAVSRGRAGEKRYRLLLSLRSLAGNAHEASAGRMIELFSSF